MSNGTYTRPISTRQLKAMLKDFPFEVKTKDITINGQRRGCSGFIKNTTTNNSCYITTETLFGSPIYVGLYGDKNKTIMMRSVGATMDFRGGINQWLPPTKQAIVDMAIKLTSNSRTS